MAIKHGVNGIVCAYCGQTKNEVSFVIGASREPDWCMIYGTGKMACPNCYAKGQAEAQFKMDKHVEAHNKAVARRIYAYGDGQGENWKEFIKAMNAGELCEIDEEMFYYWLEVLPPVYMGQVVKVEIDGVVYDKKCSFGFAEGADYITDFWTSGGAWFCKQSKRMNRAW